MSGVTGFVNISLSALVCNSGASELGKVSSTVVPSDVLTRIRTVGESDRSLAEDVGQVDGRITRGIIRFLDRNKDLKAVTKTRKCLDRKSSHAVRRCTCRVHVYACSLDSSVHPSRARKPCFSIALDRLRGNYGCACVIDGSGSSRVRGVFGRHLLRGKIDRRILLRGLDVVRAGILSYANFSVRGLQIGTLRRGRRRLFAHVSPCVVGKRRIKAVMKPSSTQSIISLVSSARFDHTAAVFTDTTGVGGELEKE